MNLVELGIVLRPHGYKGSIVAKSDAGRTSAFSYLKTLLLGRTADKLTTHNVIESAWMPKGWKLELSGISSEQAAQDLKGYKIFANRADLAPVQANEFYVHDLLGAAVMDALSNKECGVLASIEPLIAPDRGFAQDRWWIESGGELYSIPATTRYIQRIDVEQKTVWVKNLADFV